MDNAGPEEQRNFNPRCRPTPKITTPFYTLKLKVLDFFACCVLVGVRAECVAVDWVGRSLYWKDRSEGRINAVGLAGFRAVPVVIVDDAVDELRSLALLPQKG